MVDSDRCGWCRNLVRASVGFLTTASIYSLWRFISLLLFLLSFCQLVIEVFVLFFHFVVRQGIEGRMLRRIKHE